MEEKEDEKIDKNNGFGTDTGDGYHSSRRFVAENDKVATVKNGVVKAKKKGTCVVSCMIKGLPDTMRICYVTVKK